MGEYPNQFLRGQMIHYRYGPGDFWKCTWDKTVGMRHMRSADILVMAEKQMSSSYRDDVLWLKLEYMARRVIWC